MNDSNINDSNSSNDDAVQGATPTVQNEARIQKILKQTQREAGTRDLLTFAFGRAWSVLLILGATFVVIADQYARNSSSESDDG